MFIYSGELMKRFIIFALFMVLINLQSAFANNPDTYILTDPKIGNDMVMQKYISEIGTKILNANKIDKRIVFLYISNNRTVNTAAYYKNRQVKFYRGLAAYMESDD